MKNTSKKRKSKNPGCFILLMFPITLIFLTVIVLLFAYFISRREYNIWEESFESKLISTDFTYPNDESEEAKKITKSLNQKLTEFVDPNVNNSYIELSEDEFSKLLTDEISSSMPPSIKLKKTYINTNDNQIDLYIDTVFKEIEMPWVRIVLVKESVEGFEFNVKQIFIGNWDLDEKGFYFVREDLNNGLKEAFVLIEQSHFTGRSIENIEIEDNVVIVRGGTYN